jgi:glycosyltransferase involved in cell wall biosynthesis
MRRILFAYPEVSPIFPNGGIGTFVFEVSNLLSASGKWEVDILTDTAYSPSIMQDDFRKAEGIFRKAGIRLIDLDRENGDLPLWESFDLMRAERYHAHVSRLHSERYYDLIEFPDCRAPGFFVVRHKRNAGSFNDTRLIVHLHSSVKDIWEWHEGYFTDRNDLYCHYMEEYVKKYSDIALSPTEFLLRPVHQTQGTFEKPFYRNGYPISHYESSSNLETVRRSNTVTVACISRLERRKGQDILANGIHYLSESGSLDDNVQFVFCGKDNIGLDRDGWMSESIRRILKGVRNWKIIKPKSRRDLADWLTTEIDICVVPSRVDNYPNVVIEAARAGCYVIASDAGGIPEIFKDYRIYGSLCPSGDSDALTQEILKAIKHVRENPDIRPKISGMFEESRKLQANRTLSIYDEMAELSEKSKPITLDKNVNPRVSVIIPFYNSHHMIDTIKSAFASDYTDFEVIMVNDQSDSPNSLEFLKEVVREFPQLIIIHKQDGGLGDALNAGLKVASGEFIVPLDADNILLPNMLRRCSRVLSERQSLSYITTYFECIREEDQATIPWQLSPDPKPLGAVDPYVLMENTVGNTPAMIRKSALESVGGYSTNVFGMEDWDLWLKFHEKGLEGDVLPEVHYIHRLRSDGISDSINVLNSIRLKQSLLRRHESLVREHSLSIASLFLNERKYERLGPEEDWILFGDMLRRAMNDPARAFRYLARKIKHSIREKIRNLISRTPLTRLIR